MAPSAAHCLLRYLRRSLLVLLGVLMLAGLATPATAVTVPDIATATEASAGQVGSGESDEGPMKPDLGLSQSCHHFNGEPPTGVVSAAFERLSIPVEVGVLPTDSALRAISLLPPTKPPRA